MRWDGTEIILITCCAAGTVGWSELGDAASYNPVVDVTAPGPFAVRLQPEPMQRIERDLLVRELMYEPTRERPARDWEQRERKRRRK